MFKEWLKVTPNLRRCPLEKKDSYDCCFQGNPTDLNVSWSHFLRIGENFFQSFCTKFLSLLYMISLTYKISHCFSASHNPELQCVICTGVTLFALVLYLLHWCYTWTALLSANQNWVIFSCTLLGTIKAPYLGSSTVNFPSPNPQHVLPTPKFLEFNIFLCASIW